MPALKARDWFRFQNVATDPTVAEIHVIDIIGDWIDEIINEFWGMTATLTAKGFLDQLAALDAGVQTIRVHINSPGGDVFAAANIANALRDQQLSKGRTVETVVDGLAASAASVIAMAGSRVTMADNALMMIHQPWSGAVGNAAELRRIADTLDTVTATIVATYQWHSELNSDEIVALLDAETWMTADEAVAKGFATDKLAGLKAAASIDARVAGKLRIPDKYRDRVQAFIAPTPAEPVKATALEIVRACADAPELAEELISAGATLEQVNAKVATAKAGKQAEAARVATITALCGEFKQPELAASYIGGGMPVEQVRAQLAVIRGKQDTIEIDGGLNPNHGQSSIAASWKKVIARVQRSGVTGARS